MQRLSVARVLTPRQHGHCSLPAAASTSRLVTRTYRRSYATVHATVSRPVVTQDPTLHAKSAPAAEQTRPDPHTLLAPQLDRVRETLYKLLGSTHPTLTELARYYFLQPSKQLRPLLVLLFAKATNGLGGRYEEKKWAADCEGAGGRTEELDFPLSRPDVLTDWNPNIPEHTASFSTLFALRPPLPPQKPPIPPPLPSAHALPFLSGAVLPTQLRLAQIVEMIHVSSLLHDDVVDNSPLRRGAPSAHITFGTKMTVLAGDFLLGRGSLALARLGDLEVVELMATVITNLVEGEILQTKMKLAKENKMLANQDHWNLYLQKTYMKTASLMAKAARSSVVLGGCKEGEVWKEIAYAYGRNLGIAFQLVDDVLDYDSGEGTLGKPGGADLKLGLTTGPALFAWEEHPEMGPMIQRKFSHEGDVELARELVRKSSGLERTRDMARAYVDKAKEVLAPLPDSEAKSALEVLAERVVKRKS